jgi:adenylate kinase family enzyme
VQRVAIIGCPGSGKTTLALALGPRVGLPVFHLDREFWLPGWQKPSRRDWAVKHAALVAAERWLIEGGYLEHCGDRVQRSDLTIFLDIPLPVCFVRVLLRSIANLGRRMPYEPEGCPGRLDFKLLARALNYKRKHRALGEFVRKHLPDNGELVIIRNNRDIDRLLARAG